MTVLKCLYFEDDPGEAIQVQQYLEHAWSLIVENKLEELTFATTLPSMDIEMVYDPHEALKKIDKERGKYQLLVVDLLYEDKATKTFTKEGMRLVEAVRDHDLTVGIIAVSIGEQRTSFAGIKKEFETSAGLKEPGPYNTYGRYFIAKPELFVTRGIEFKALAKIILHVLVDAGVLQPPEGNANRAETVSAQNADLDIVYDAQHHPLKVAVETIGKANLANLSAQFLGVDFEKCKVKYVRPGMSGAYVFQLASSHQEKRSRNLLLKVSNSEPSLRREIERYPEIGEALSQCFVRYSEQLKFTPRRDWFAIAADFALDAVTLIRWLTEIGGRDKLDPAVLMREVFLGNLSRAYSTVVQGKTQSTPINDLFPTSARVAKIYVALQELGQLAKKYGRKTGTEFQQETLEDYLNHNKVGSVSADKPSRLSSFCRCHGDLHGKNILVHKTAYNFKLIDPGDVDDLHWAVDMARFCVDLIASAWDSGTASHEWSNFGKWREVAVALVTNQAVPQKHGASGSNRRVRIALDWCRAHLRDLYGDRIPATGPSWEFQLALAVEFMRSAYRPDVATPKRVLGLVAAYDGLLECERSLRALTGNT